MWLKDIGRMGRRTSLVLALGLALGGCSYVSLFAAVGDLTGGHDVQNPKTQEACERARLNMVTATDPVEARQWEILREDLDCPTQRELIERN